MLGQKRPRIVREPLVLVEGTITRLAPQKKKPNRASIHIDGKFAFGIMQGVILEFGLHNGKVLTVEAQRRIIEASDFMGAKAAALEYIGYRLRSEQEVRTKLLDKGFPEKAVERTVARMLELRYIDDVRFATSYTKERMNINRHGRHRIGRDLKQRGVDPELIARTMEEVNDDDAIDAARRVAQAKWKRLRTQPDRYKQYKKIYSLLARRGFHSDIVRIVMDEIKKDQPPITEQAKGGKKAKKRVEISDEKALELARKRWGQLGRLEPNAYKRSQKLKDFLRRKGVSFEVISGIQATFSAEQEEEEAEAKESKTAEEEQEEQDEQFADMVEQAQRRWPKVQRLEKNKRKQRQKLQDYLRRRGFDFSMIQRLFDEELLEA